MTEATVHFVKAVVYALVALAGLWYVRQYEAPARQVGYVVIGVLVVSVLGAIAAAADILTYQAAIDAEQSFPEFVDDTVAYGFLFGLTAWFAGVSRRMIALVAGLSVLSRVAIEIGGYLGETAIAVALLLSVGTFLARVYLLWGPVWRSAQSMPAGRRLLYWKARNLLMFLMGMNIVGVVLIGAALVNPFVELLVLEYVDLLLRAGFIGFLIANLGALESADTRALFADAAGRFETVAD